MTAPLDPDPPPTFVVFTDPSLDVLRRTIGLEHDDDDDVLQRWGQDAEAMLRKFLRPNVLTGVEKTELYDGGVIRIHLRRWPLLLGSDGLPDLTKVTLFDMLLDPEDAVDQSLYAVDARHGWLTARDVVAGNKRFFPAGIDRFKVTYTGGLDQDPEWADVIRPELRRSLEDLLVDWYENRNPRTGGKLPIGSADMGALDPAAAVPERILSVWRGYREIL